jgi:hypothetical protein
MDSINDLYSRVWKTRGARLEAHKRYKRIDSLSTWTINILSVCIIAISLLAIVPLSNFQFLKGDIGSIYTAILSISILVVSLIESSKGYKQKADKMHECAKELSKVYSDLKLAKDNVQGTKGIVELANTYQAIIDKYDNHIDLDFNRFKAKERKEFGLSLAYYCFIEIQYAIRIYIPFLLPFIAFIALAYFLMKNA